MLHLCLVLANLAIISNVQAQLFKIELDQKTKNSSLIAEGEVTAQRSFWNEEHTMIYTANTVQVYKTFKGKTTTSNIEVITQGGTVGTFAIEASDLLTLRKGQVGVFFCHPNVLSIKSPTTKSVLYDVYSSDQGFLRYDLTTNKAYAPFASYNDIENNLYPAIEKRTGEVRKVVNNSFSVAKALKLNASSSENGGAGALAAVITSFLPATVHAGALNDPTNNTLTISGSGFSNNPSGSAGVKFKDGNSDNDKPDYLVEYYSPYIVSWKDNEIVVRVPARAATGKIAVVNNNAIATQSATTLTVTYAVINFNFSVPNGAGDSNVVLEPRLMNVNGKGGYNYRFSTSTAGKGKSFAADDSAVSAFTRAAATWQQVVGANLSPGSTTTVQKISGTDGINLVEYDNTNTGVPPMADGVLEVTYSSGSVCYLPTPFTIFTAQKTGFDILLRNTGVSVGNVNFQKGPCPPPGLNIFDLENIILHELGHALNLTHVNDGFEVTNSSYNNINPGKIMHYSILDYVDRRSLDNSAYQGGLYTVTPQEEDVFGTCPHGYAEQMQPLDFTPLANDECPGVFPATATQSGTVVDFDLVHATSNKYKDPAFTQINCNNTGTSVTNNAWYALKTDTRANGTLSIKISGYATTPANFTNCVGQGVRMAIYAVNACPVGQNFPQPVACATFTGNSSLPDITGLAANTTYLLYFDGLRNTKATFKVTLNGSALPIVLADFKGEYIHGINNLYINITQAVNVKNINIEKSADGNNFSHLDALNVPSSQLVGNHTYSDAQPFAGNNYYRLKIVDNDGNVQYSKTILLRNTASKLVYVYPNPAKSNVNVSFSGMPAGRYNFTVYSIAGKALYTKPYTLPAGNQTISLPLTMSASGVYMVKITNANGEVVSQQKVIKE